MRVEHRESIETFSYPSLRLEVTKKDDGRILRVNGWLNSRVTGLATDTLLFKDEAELGELLDDLSEALDAVSILKDTKKES